MSADYPGEEEKNVTVRVRGQGVKEDPIEDIKILSGGKAFCLNNFSKPQRVHQQEGTVISCIGRIRELTG